MISAVKENWFQKLRNGLKRTHNQWASGITRLFLGKKVIDAELFAELEVRLLEADVGVATTTFLLAELTKAVERQSLNSPAVLLNHLRAQMIALLEPYSEPLSCQSSTGLFTLLMVGVNGAGKTTSIAKIARYFQKQNKKIMLAAGDTFRAAAVDQLKIWAQRQGIPVIAQRDGADSASVIYDALHAASARGCDLLIADTAGRLHTQSHLMNELAKIKRVMAKVDPAAPSETMLVLDAGTGQNALVQAEQFNNAIGVDSIALTKLDGTAKGGIVFALARKMQLPIRFIGVGEKMDDLKPFNAREFVDALFAEDE